MAAPPPSPPPAPSGVDGRSALLISEAAAARETNNEDRYRALFSDLLSRFQERRSSSSSEEGGEGGAAYGAEKALLSKAVQNETAVLAGGVAVGLAVFLTMRYLPTYLIWRLGNKEKLQKMREAQAKASAARSAFSLAFEASFGFWAGWRGYHMLSASQAGTYEALAGIPLVEGRSELSDSLCGEWTRIVRERVPPAFWKNVDLMEAAGGGDGGGGGDDYFGRDKPKLKDIRTWTAIRKFSENCLKRDSYERRIRAEQGLADDASVMVPSSGVPEATVPSRAMRSVELLSQSDANRLTDDEKKR